MVEPIMFFGIGFLVASLLGLVIVPLVHGRAVRLTMRRLEAATPLSLAEIQADKDQLRAEFAMSTRRLEMSVEQLKSKTTSQLAELGKKTDAINRMKIELGEKTASIFALEAREKLLKDQVRASEDEIEIKTVAMRELERTLADKESELAKLSNNLTDRTLLADSQRVELAALNAQMDALKSRLDDAERALRDTEDRLGKERTEVEATTRALAEERGKVENLGNRVTDLERQLIAQSTEAEILARRASELEQQLGDQVRQLAEREYECDQLRLAAQAAAKVEADLRAELAGIDGRHQAATQTLRSERGLIERQLERASEEGTRLQAELSALKRDAEGSWASERVESALLRERINDIAAEVARLAVALEGPDSPIEVILAEGASHGGNGHGTAGAAPEGGNLAERIRALQSRASRIQQ
jgi:chromosome segregation ATPase